MPVAVVTLRNCTRVTLTAIALPSSVSLFATLPEIFTTSPASLLFAADRTMMEEKTMPRSGVNYSGLVWIIRQGKVVARRTKWTIKSAPTGNLTWKTIRMVRHVKYINADDRMSA